MPPHEGERGVWLGELSNNKNVKVSLNWDNTALQEAVLSFLRVDGDTNVHMNGKPTLRLM